VVTVNSMVLLSPGARSGICSVIAPGQVRLTVRNTAKQLTHNFTFTAGKGPAAITEQIPLLAPGESKTIEFTVTTPGDYPFECSFHVALGQVGTMTVSS
jgi:plastocyanin